MKGLSTKTRFLNFFRQAFMNPVAERVLINLMRKFGHTHWTGKLLPNNYQYKRGSIRKTTVNGISFDLDVHNWNDWEVYFRAHGVAINRLIDLCKIDDVVIDVGSNIGFVLMSMATKVGAGGKVFGFEPNPVTFEKLEKNLSRNNFFNISIEKAALGNQQGKVEPFTVSENNLGMSKVRLPSGIVDVVTVPLYTLDSFCEDRGINRINLIKIDVEGYETNVLMGSLQTIKKFRPVLFIELSAENLKNQSTSPEEVISTINQFGYRITRPTDNFQITSDYVFEKDCHFDILCTPLTE